MHGLKDMKAEPYCCRTPLVATACLALIILVSVLDSSSFVAIRNQKFWQILQAKDPSLPPAQQSFGSQQSSDWQLSDAQRSSSDWLSSEALWRVVAAGHPRFPNRCSHSSCPSPSPTSTRSSPTGRSQAAALPQLQSLLNQSLSPRCPDYFRFIHEYLAPWKDTKISKSLLDSARGGNNQASFTVFIYSGRLFVKPIGNCYQTRAIFSIWGLLQLLKYYPGLVPDLELVFGCGDRPAIQRTSDTHNLPSPVFRYCTTLDHFDIPFPDWSYWGWPEVNIEPWESELQSILKGSSKMAWRKRIPKAFWKGNLYMGDGARMELKKCNGNTADIRGQNWNNEEKAKFQNSKLSEQCRHRFKVYVEGIGWSVSLKYILACNSPVLLVSPQYLEFFARGLVPKKHFLPVPPTDKMCPTIDSAVKWGNEQMQEAMELGKQGSRFVFEEVSMARVYDYMLHLLKEYANLLDFKPVPDADLQELCSDAFLCVSPTNELPFYESSMVHHASESPPCFFDLFANSSFSS